jgi:hypothetical protein
MNSPPIGRGQFGICGGGLKDVVFMGLPLFRIFIKLCPEESFTAFCDQRSSSTKKLMLVKTQIKSNFPVLVV